MNRMSPLLKAVLLLALCVSVAIDVAEAGTLISGLATKLVRKARKEAKRPTPPSGLVAAAFSDDQISLSWSASSDSDGIAEYLIYRDGSTLIQIAPDPSGGDTGLAAGTTHCYRVRARDNKGYLSRPSAKACATTLAAPPADLVPPTVTAVSPSSGAGSVRTDVRLEVTFSEEITGSSEAGPATVSDASGNIVAGTTTISGKTLTFTPASPLTPGTLFTATITTAVKDLAGNSLKADYSWQFTTGGILGVIADLVASDDPQYVYGIDRDRQVLYTIDTVSRNVAEEIPLPFPQPVAMSYAAADRKLYIVSEASSEVTVFDSSSKRFSSFSYGAGHTAFDVEVASTLRRIYILSYKDEAHYLTILNQDSGAVISTSPVSGDLLVVDPVSKTAITGDTGLSPSSLYKYSVEGDEAVLLQSLWNAGGNGIQLAISHDGTRFVFACGGGNSDYGYVLYDFPTADVNAVAGEWNIGTYPKFARFSPNDKVLYGSNGDFYDNYLYMMDATNYQLIRKVEFPNVSDYGVFVPNSDGTVVVGFSYDTYYNKDRRLYFFDGVTSTSATTPSPLAAVDYVAGSGDNWLTRDNLSGLEWLDVSLTAGLTYDEVRTGEWYVRGFRHATAQELRTLFEHAGTPDDGFDVSVTYAAETKKLIDLLGATDIGATLGLTGTDFLGQDVSLETHPVGTQFSALLGKLNYFDLRGMGAVGEAHFTGGHPMSDEAGLNVGSFLVRPFR